MTAQELIASLNLSGEEVKTFREMWDDYSILVTALTKYSQLLSMPLELELFENVKSKAGMPHVFYGVNYGVRVNLQTIEYFINNCRQAGISLRWK